MDKDHFLTEMYPIAEKIFVRYTNLSVCEGTFPLKQIMIVRELLKFTAIQTRT